MRVLLIDHAHGRMPGLASRLRDAGHAVDQAEFHALGIDRSTLTGIDLITVEARVVVASIDTYIKYSEAVGQTAQARPQQGQVVSKSTEALMAENAELRAQLQAEVGSGDGYRPRRRGRSASRN